MILEGFDDIEDLKSKYEIEDSDLEGYEILFGIYETGSYDGDSIVLLKKDKKLYIVSAMHCSCHGLEGDWDPIETCEEALRKEITAKSHYGSYEPFVKFCNDYFGWVKE